MNKDLDKLIYIQSAVECGVHSGIPCCCITFFVTKKLWMSKKQLQNYTLKISYAETKLKKWNYIPCPKCLSKKIIVKTLSCPNGFTCSPEDRSMKLDLLTKDMKENISNIEYGFNLIKLGATPYSGSISRLVTNNIASITKIMDEKF